MITFLQEDKEFYIKTSWIQMMKGHMAIFIKNLMINYDEKFKTQYFY
jgi:hypothetical protein